MSDSSANSKLCQQCGAEISAATGGLCPRCLMAQIVQPTQPGDPAAAIPALTPAELAPHFPQLGILECLGRGGMGVVYKARQKTLNRLVALKLLAPERVTDAKFAQRFTHEAQALAALNHPSIVTIYDFGQAGGFYFLLMEFVDGVNLRQAMKAGRFTPEQALAVVPPVCEALQYAHEHGIVHRDIKPENLLLDKEGRVKIADFGIAKILGAPAFVAADNEEATPGDADVPGSGAPLQSEPTLASIGGTPQYMAPEQKAHRVTDHRADIYSLGVVLYELLTGELPADKLQPPSRKVQIDVRLDEIVLRALAAQPERRYQTAGEFRTQVETITREYAVTPTVSGREPDRFVRFLVRAIYGVAVLIASWPVIGWIADPMDRGHLGRFVLCLLVALGVAVAGKLFSLVVDALLSRNTGMLRRQVETVAVDPTPSDSAASRGANAAPQPRGSGWRKVWIGVGITVLIAIPVRLFLVGPFVVTGDSAAPEIPAGSRILVWKPAHAFASGDMIAYDHRGNTFVGRVVGAADGSVTVNRNGQPDEIIARQRVTGKVISVYWRATPPMVQSPVRSRFPKSSHIMRNAGTVLVHHDEVDLHYVLFTTKAAGSSASDQHNTDSLAWRDHGSFKVTEQQTFGYDREATDPFHLQINGKEYELRRGRVFVTHDDGTVEQLKLFPPLATASNPEELAKLIAPARAMNGDPITVEKLRHQLEAAEAQLHDVLKTCAPTHPFVVEVRESIVALKQRIKEPTEHQGVVGTSVIFGPVIEREMIAVEPLVNGFLDLDTGALLSAPKRMADMLTRGQINGGSPDVPYVREWMRSSGADVVIQAMQPPRLIQADGFVGVLATPQQTKPKTATLENVSAADVLRQIENHKPNTDGTPNGATLHYEPTCVSAFVTREGGIGILEIVRIEGRAVKLRYRLLRDYTGTRKAFRPIPPAASVILDSIKALPESVAGRNDDPGPLAAILKERSAKRKELAALLQGTEAQALMDRGDELDRELSNTVTPPSPERREAINEECKELEMRIRALHHNAPKTSRPGAL